MKMYKRGQKVTVRPDLSLDMVLQTGIGRYAFDTIKRTIGKTYTIKSDDMGMYRRDHGNWYLLYNDTVYNEAWLIPVDGFDNSIDDTKVTINALKELLN